MFCDCFCLLRLTLLLPSLFTAPTLTSSTIMTTLTWRRSYFWHRLFFHYFIFPLTILLKFNRKSPAYQWSHGLSYPGLLILSEIWLKFYHTICEQVPSKGIFATFPCLNYIWLRYISMSVLLRLLILLISLRLALPELLFLLSLSCITQLLPFSAVLCLYYWASTIFSFPFHIISV